MRNIIKYFREISVVVIGIAITFLVSDWISNRNEKNKANRYLATVMRELQENQKLVRHTQHFYKKTYELSTYLLKDKPENHNADSIRQLSIHNENGASVIHEIFTLAIETTSFETLVASGIMGLIDEQLSNSILRTYKRLDRMKMTNEGYMNRKNELTFNVLLENNLTYEEMSDLTDPRLSKIFYFYALPNNYEEQLRICEDMIEETLELFPAKLKK